MSYSFGSVQEGTKAVLLESTNIVRSLNVPFAIAGGWSLYLRYQNFRHPGTADVDILFEHAGDRGYLRNMFLAFARAGYLPSAKHPFQLLREIKVGNETFVFNVDILHPGEVASNPELMIDHIDLDVFEGVNARSHWKQMSMALPASAFVFRKKCLIDFNVSGTLPDGAMANVTIPLLDDIAIFITKFQSVRSPKRPRDAFDLYLAVTKNPDKKRFVQDLQALRAESNINELTEEFIEYAKGGSTFADNVRSYLGLGTKCDPVREVTEVLELSSLLPLPSP